MLIFTTSVTIKQGRKGCLIAPDQINLNKTLKNTEIPGLVMVKKTGKNIRYRNAYEKENQHPMFVIPTTHID